MKMSCRSLALLVALAALLAACQPTPEEDVVVNKGDGPAFAFATEAPGGAAAAVETPAPTAAPYAHPEGDFAHEERLHEGHLIIRVAAEVEAEAAQAMPVQRMELRPFTPEQFAAFADWAGVAQLLYQEAPPDRVYWAERLAWAQQGIPNGDGGLFVDEEMIAYCRAQWELAPERVEAEPFDMRTLRADMDFACDIRFPDGTIGYAGLLAGSEGCFTYRRDREIASNVCPETALDSGLTMAGSAVDGAEAAGLAQQAAAALGAEGLVVDTVEERALVYERSQTAVPAVCVVLVRSSGGLTAYDMGTAFVMTERSYPAYGAPWPQERLEVCVDGEGLATIHYQGMARPTGESAAAALLPFERLLPLVTQQLARLSSFALRTDWYYTVEVVRWRLGTSLTSLANDPDAGVMTPTWYVTCRETSAPEPGAEGYTTERTVAFNALDGSYLEPRITNAILMARGK